MLKLSHKKKRMAFVSDRKNLSKKIAISRNTRNGDSFSVQIPGYPPRWMTVDTEEFLAAIEFVTHTDQELIEMGYKPSEGVVT